MGQTFDQSGFSRDLTDRNLLHVAKQASGVMTFRLLGTLLGLGSNLIFARYLGAELLGVVVLATTALLVLTLVASIGMGRTFIRYLPVHLSRGNKKGAAGIFRLGMRIVLAASALAGIVLYLGRGFLASTVFKEPLIETAIPIVAVAAIPATLYLVLGQTLRALRWAARETLCKEIVFKSIKLGVFFLLVFLGFKLEALLGGFVAGYAVAALAMIFFIQKRWPFLLRGPSEVSVRRRELYAFTGTMLFVGFMNYSMSITDRTMLGIISTTRDVGLYNIAFLISNVLSLIFMAMNEAFSPIVSELYHNGKHGELRSLYSSLTRVVLIIIVPGLIWLVGFGDDLLGMFGSEFRVGYVPLVVLGIGVLARCLVGTVSPLLILSGHERYNAANIVAVTAMNILMNLWLIPRYGVLGAAYATAISLAIVNAVALIEVRKLMGITPYATSYLKLLVPAAVTLAGTLVLRANTPPFQFAVIAGILGATLVVFFGILALLGIERDDRLILGRLWARLGGGGERGSGA